MSGPCSPQPLRRAASRGFTLVELMLALVAGMAVAYAAFLMSKNATRFFQHESRISTAQLSLTLGASRLTADIQRAGFLSSPNIQADPAYCPGPSTLPPGLAQLAALQISDTALTDVPQSDANGLAPQSIIIGGAFDTTEQFPVRSIVDSGAGLQIILQRDSGPMARTGAARIPAIFQAGRILRIVDAEGRHEYGVIASTTAVTDAGGNTYQVNLEQTPAIPIRDAGTACGISTGFNTGLLVNPVSRVRYSLRSLAGDAAYGPLVAPQNADMSGDAGRTELVREELDANDNVMGSSTELVAEFAVDLRFGLTYVTAAAPNTPVTLDVNNATVTAIAGNVVTGGVNAFPQLVRSVQMRFTTRTRAPDRAVGLGPNDDGRVSRFKVDTVKGSEQFFRARSLYTDIELPNLRGSVW